MDDAYYTYPDVSALCGRPQFRDGHADILTNPSVIVEVLSPSTAAYDRGRKFSYYQRLESLREYVMIAQETMHVELYTRSGGDVWLRSEYSQPDDAVTLPSVNAELRSADIYEKVDLDDVAE